jgi:hypothetical protein
MSLRIIKIAIGIAASVAVEIFADRVINKIKNNN